MTLYCMPRACSRVTMTALEAIGLPYERQVINIFTQQQKTPEYLAIHPGGKVPALSVDGEVLTENASILLYLHQTYPEGQLLPESANAVQAAQKVSELVWCGGTLHPIIRQVRMPIRFTDGDPSGVREKGVEMLTAVLERIAPRLASQDWWFGDRWSIVDVYFAWCCMVAQSGGFPLDKYPAVLGHRERLFGIESFARAVEKDEAAIAEHGIEFPG
ncbi:MAG: glutathione S-transferase family protein [Pseudomonadota bacterium]